MPNHVPNHIRHKRVHIARRGVIYSLILCAVILLFGGFGFWLLDPMVETLPVLSLATASLAAIFVEKDVEAEEKHMEHDLMRELKHVREELQALRDEIKAKNNP